MEVDTLRVAVDVPELERLGGRERDAVDVVVEERDGPSVFEVRADADVLDEERAEILVVEEALGDFEGFEERDAEAVAVAVRVSLDDKDCTGVLVVVLEELVVELIERVEVDVRVDVPLAEAVFVEPTEMLIRGDAVALFEGAAVCVGSSVDRTDTLAFALNVFTVL